MKRIGERLKQTLNYSSSKQWTPTSNARNEAMEKEVRKFAQQLKLMHKQLTDLDTSIQGGLTSFKAVLLSPLPRAYDEQQGTGVVPIDSEVRLLGVNVDTEGFTVASTEMHQRLRTEVLLPLEQWLTEYRAAKDNNRKCEELRLDLDNKRRSTLALHDKVARTPKNHKDYEPTLQKVQTEEDKLTRLLQRYAEKEAEVFNAFLRLIRDSAVLRDYAAMGLAILQRCLTSAYTAFDLTTPMPLPMLPAPAQVAPQGMTESIMMSQGSLGAGSPSMPRSIASSRPATTSSGGIPHVTAHAGGSTGTSGLPACATMPPMYATMPPASPNGTESGYFGRSMPHGQPGTFPNSTGGSGVPTPSQGSFHAPSSQPGYFTNPNVPVVAPPLPSNHKSAAMPPPPSWYTEAYSRSRPGFDTDGEADAGNPFEKRASGSGGGQVVPMSDGNPFGGEPIKAVPA